MRLADSPAAWAVVSLISACGWVTTFVSGDGLWLLATFGGIGGFAWGVAAGLRNK